MTLKNNKVFQFVTAVLYKIDFSRVGTCFSPFIFAYACSYLRDRFLVLERSNDFLNEVLDIKPKINKSRTNSSWPEKHCFLNASETLAAAYLIALA